MIHIEPQGAVDLLRLEGTLNAEAVKEMDSKIERCFVGGVPMLVCDFGEVQLIDSAGMEWLLDTLEKVVQRGGAIKLAGMSSLVAEILRLTGVSDRFEVFEDAKIAVGSFSR